MRLSDFDYELPGGLIARHPMVPRDSSRLMVLDRAGTGSKTGVFSDIISFFNKGDALVVNDTRVIPARLFGKRNTGGKVEVFLLGPCKDGNECEALLRPSGKVRPGERIALESGTEIVVLERGEAGRRVRFSEEIDKVVSRSGHIPLPPYLKRPDEPRDRIDYQTVYAARDGATASPTAGLHFTRGLLERIRARGVKVVYVTLHTGYGTFAPIKTDEVQKHRIHREYFEFSPEACRAIRETKNSGNAVFSVGTTTTRVLEHCAGLISSDEGVSETVRGHTDLFVYPGYSFRVVDHLVTNFHLPRSTLLLLVSAFAGRDRILEAYREAVEKRFRFFSYGDAMLIL